MAALGSITEQNIVIKQGGKFEMAVNVEDANGDPLSLAGWTARMQIRPNRGSATLYQNLTTGSGLTIVGSAVWIDIEGTVTAGYTWLRGYYDLFVINPSSSPYCVLEGLAFVDQRVTVIP